MTKGYFRSCNYAKAKICLVTTTSESMSKRHHDFKARPVHLEGLGALASVPYLQFLHPSA